MNKSISVKKNIYKLFGWKTDLLANLNVYKNTTTTTTNNNNNTNNTIWIWISQNPSRRWPGHIYS